MQSGTNSSTDLSDAQHSLLPVILTAVATRVLTPVQTFGRFVLLLGRAASSLHEVRIYGARFLDQVWRIGFESIPIVALAALFSGAVTTVQAAYQLVSPFIPRSVIGSIVAPSIILELGAVVSAFILAGRVGARIAAELGTMRVTEQIDALEAMGLNSVGYLILPRILAGIVMFPVLYVVSCVVGIGGSILVADWGGLLSRGEFLQGARDFFRPFDAWFGIIKAVTFGFVITSVACFKGYYTGGGAEGVGRATTEAAVTACVFILLADLLLAVLLL